MIILLGLFILINNNYLIKCANIIPMTSDLKFFEEPLDTYFISNSPVVTLKCKLENARTGFFKCNDKWMELESTSKIIQVGNKKILTIELDITQEQIEKDSSSLYWCQCQGWSNNGDTIISRKALVKKAFIEDTFIWEPMTTFGLLGKSVEIRCLPPDGEPKPSIYWLKDGLKLITNKRVLISHEGSLLINEVRSSDEGNYTCIAENQAGKRISDSAKLSTSEDKGWSEWSNWTECESLTYDNCGEGVRKRFRSCLNPPLLNNALSCDGFPMQILNCQIPCIEFKWSEWSEWTVDCEVSVQKCYKKRTRKCLNKMGVEDELKCDGVNIESITINETLNKIFDKYTISLIISITILILFIISITLFICFICIKRLKNKSKLNKNRESTPIYHSVLPEFSLDSCLLPNESCLTSTTYSSSSSAQSPNTLSTTSSPSESLKYPQTLKNLEKETDLIKLIQNSAKQEAKCDVYNRIQYENCDLYSFNVFKSGGYLEIPKYSYYALIPDDSIDTSIQIGIDYTNTEGLYLTQNQTLLSEIHVIKSENQTNFNKPCILSLDHSAKNINSNWSYSLIYKSLTSSNFEIVQDSSINLYITNNRFFLVTNKPGYYGLIGEPNIKSTKIMRYALIMNSLSIKIILIQNTRASIESINEELAKLRNGKCLQMPKEFDLNFINEREELKFEISFENELNKIVKNVLFNEIWQSNLYEIEIPLLLNKLNTQNLNIQFKTADNSCLFSFSNTYLNYSPTDSQEFYSCVTVNPIFVPLNLITLLDNCSCKYFKTKNLNSILAQLRTNFEQQLFTIDKSYELLMSLWLLINLTTCN